MDLFPGGLSGGFGGNDSFSRNIIGGYCYYPDNDLDIINILKDITELKIYSVNIEEEFGKKIFTTNFNNPDKIVYSYRSNEITKRFYRIQWGEKEYKLKRLYKYIHTNNILKSINKYDDNGVLRQTVTFEEINGLCIPKYSSCNTSGYGEFVGETEFQSTYNQNLKNDSKKKDNTIIENKSSTNLIISFSFPSHPTPYEEIVEFEHSYFLNSGKIYMIIFKKTFKFSNGNSHFDPPITEIITYNENNLIKSISIGDYSRYYYYDNKNRIIKIENNKGGIFLLKYK
jgi:hypothetical protein